MHWSSLMFFVCLVHSTLCSQCLFILHEVRVPCRSLLMGLWKVSQVKSAEVEKMQLSSLVSCVHWGRLICTFVHVETQREQCVSVCDRLPAHPAFEGPLNRIFTLNLKRKQRCASYSGSSRSLVLLSSSFRTFFCHWELLQVALFNST